MPKLSTAIDSDSSCSSIDSRDYSNTEDKYGDMIWRLLEGENNGVYTLMKLIYILFYVKSCKTDVI